jgi:signal transduction histidine kinase
MISGGPAEREDGPVWLVPVVALPRLDYSRRWPFEAFPGAWMCGRIGGVDERGVHVLGQASAALAVENERLQRELRSRLEEERALRRVATLVAQQHEPEMVLTVVTEEVARHLAAESALTVRYDSPERATIVAEWSAPGTAAFPRGGEIEMTPKLAVGQVYATLAPARVDSYEDMPGEYPALLRQLGMRASVAAPILVDGHLWGAVAAGSTAEPFTADSEVRLGAFAELVAQAIANVDARVKLKESRARIVAAADEARRRIERDLHDGAQQHLVSLALSLRFLAQRAEPATAWAIEGCIADLQTALSELRELARGLHPAVLTERGLGAALPTLAAHSPVPVVLDEDLEGRLPPAQETALYFVAAEALTNVAKYARASTATVALRSNDGWAEITVADDGVGGARPDQGSGLRGLADRVEALGGRLTVASPPGKGTTVSARLPMATDRASEISHLAASE